MSIRRFRKCKQSSGLGGLVRQPTTAEWLQLNGVPPNAFESTFVCETIPGAKRIANVNSSIGTGPDVPYPTVVVLMFSHALIAIPHCAGF